MKIKQPLSLLLVAAFATMTPFATSGLALPAAEADVHHSVILRGQPTAELRSAVAELGAETTHDLEIIEALGARLSVGQLDQIRERHPEIEVVLTGAVRVSSGQYVTVRDDFEQALWDNNDGTRPWASDWIEVEPKRLDETLGPEAGRVRISRGSLRLNDANTSNIAPSASRRVDLSQAEAISLSFEFRTNEGVDADDSIAVELSRDGGESFVLLDHIRGIEGKLVDSRTYDISGFAGAETDIRFRIDNDYRDTKEHFFLLDLEVAYNEVADEAPGPGPVKVAEVVSVLEDFETGSWDSSSTSLPWTGSWLESDPSGTASDPGSGQVRIEDGRLRLDDNPDSGGWPSAARRLDWGPEDKVLSLGFDYATSSSVDASDAVAVEISTDGGITYEALKVFTGISGAMVGRADFDLSGVSSNDVTVRFRVTNLYGGSNEYFFVDNVELEVSTSGSVDDPDSVSGVDSETPDESAPEDSVSDDSRPENQEGDDQGTDDQGTDDQRTDDQGADDQEAGDQEAGDQEIDSPESNSDGSSLLPCDSTQASDSWWYNPYTCFPSLIRADQVHQAGVTGKGVGVAFLDTGLFSHHNILHDSQGRYRLRAQYDAAKDYEYRFDFFPTDEHGHGGHVASVALSSVQAENGLYNGVAPDADLIFVKAFGSSGTGSYADVIRGIGWVVANKDAYGIRVLNLSISSDARSRYWDDPLNQAVMAAWREGIVVVASAGNKGPDPMSIGVPGNNPYVITVGAMTDNYTPGDPRDDYLANFSAVGPTREGFLKPEIVAPGGHILGMMSTWSTLAKEHPEKHDGGHYFSMSGTSQAAAITTGVVALMLENEPSLTPDKVKRRLVLSARPAVDQAGLPVYGLLQQGAGLVDAYRAVFGSLPGAAVSASTLKVDVESDLSGEEHFFGPVRQNPDGSFTLVGPDGFVWSDAFVWNDGFVWSDAFVWSDGFVWSDAFVWSDGFVWSDAFVWSDGFVWSDAFVWSDGFVWSDAFVWNDAFIWADGFVWSDAFIWSDSLSEPSSVNVWVDDE